MLLFLLSLFSYYDLFNCNQEGQPNFNNSPLSVLVHKSIREIDALLRDFQQEIQKEKKILRTVDFEEEEKNFKEDLGLFDYSLTPYWWHGIGKDTGQHTTNATFLPTPEGFGIINYSKAVIGNNLWSKLNSLPDIFYETTRLDRHSTHTLNHEDSMASAFFAPAETSTFRDYHVDTLEHVTPITPPYYVPPLETPPRHGMASANTPNHADYGNNYENTTMPSASINPPLLPGALRGSTAKPISSFKIFTNLRTTKMKVGKPRTGYTPVYKPIKGNRITPKPRTLARTLSKAQAWVHDRRWTTTPTPGRITSAKSQETPRKPVIRTSWTRSTHTGYTGNLLHEDTAGFLYVSVPSVLYTTTPTISTVAGDVLFSAQLFTKVTVKVTNSNQRYLDIMNATDDGYLIVFISELSKLIALKEEKALLEVLGHAEVIMNKLFEEDKIDFAGRQIKKIAVFISRMCSDAVFDPGYLQSQAKFLHLLLNNRDVSLSHEVNALLNYVDLLFEDKNGRVLFNALKDFENYPQTSTTAQKVCFNLIYGFIEPFREIAATERGQAWMDTVNKAISDRIGLKLSNRRWMGDLKMMLRGATPQLDLQKRYTASMKTILNMKRRRVLNRTRNQKTNNFHRRYYSQTPWIPRLRSMLPITRHQKRFKVITPRQMWTNVNVNVDRPTMQYRKRLRRPTHPPNDMLQFFPEVPVENKREEPLKRAIHHRRIRKLKARLIRRSTTTQEEK